MITVLGWLLKLATEIALGAVLLLVVLGSSRHPNWPGPAGDIALNAIAVLLFVVSSGYFASSFASSACAGKKPLLTKLCIDEACLAAHLALVALLTGSDLLKPPALIAGAAIIVILSTSLERGLHLLTRRTQA